MMIIFFTFIFLLRILLNQCAPLENQNLRLIASKSNDNGRKIFWRVSRFKRQYGSGCSQSCCCPAVCCCAQYFPPYLPPSIIPPSPAPLPPPIISPPSPCCQISQRICCQQLPSIHQQSPSICCDPTSHAMIPSQQPIPVPAPIPVVPQPPQIFPPGQMDRTTCCNCCPCFGKGRK